MKRDTKMQKYIGYFRVSTKRQGLSGLGLEGQQHTASTYLRSVPDSKLIAEFVEVEHGTRKGNHRPQLAAAVSACRLHKATLLISKLDRLSRNVAFLSQMMESGVEFVCCDNPNATRLTIHILAAVAEDEAARISERTRAALQAAKRRGVVLGGDRGNCASIARKGNRASARIRSEAAQQRATDLAPVIQELRDAGAVTLAQVAQGLNERQIPTARGGQWSATQVMRVRA
jgi:DNA invertase Pin-like site-specific DNA recombinase